MSTLSMKAQWKLHLTFYTYKTKIWLKFKQSLHTNTQHALKAICKMVLYKGAYTNMHSIWHDHLYLTSKYYTYSLNFIEFWLSIFFKFCKKLTISQNSWIKHPETYDKVHFNVVKILTHSYNWKKKSHLDNVH